jgi:phenylacetate-CoA ligase
MRIPYGKGIEIYGKSPPSIQRALGFFLNPIPRSVMLGSGFHAFFRELNRTQWFKPEKLKRIQESRLRALIEHSYDNVPYYHRIFKARGIRPDDIRTMEDLRKLPILTKDDVRNHFYELVAANARDYEYGKVKTSGSTGDPLTFYLDQQNREIEYAAHWRQRRWANVDFNSRIASLRGFRGNLRWINPQCGKPRWKFNALSKELEFNIFGIDKATVKTQIRRLRKFRPCLIEGYPSVIELFAEYILEHNVKGISPAAVQTSSETLSNRQRDLIEKAFGCRLYDWYGESEYVVAAGQCPEGNYHIVESGLMEFIKDGEQVSEGEIGEIIGTGLYNYSMPFIRYRITDLGRYSKEKCNCGKGLAIVGSLEGRVFDSILTPNGKLLTGVSVELYWHNQISHLTPNIEHAHIIQKTRNRLLIEMVKKEGYSDRETQAILRGLKSLLGSEIQIEFKNLDSIPTGRKWRFTESELPLSLI